MKGTQLIRRMREWKHSMLPTKKLRDTLRQWKQLFALCEKNLTIAVPDNKNNRDQTFMETSYAELTTYLKGRFNYVFKVDEQALNDTEAAELSEAITRWAEGGWVVTATTGSKSKAMKPADLKVTAWSQYIIASAVRKCGTARDKLALARLGDGGHRSRKRKTGNPAGGDGARARARTATTEPKPEPRSPWRLWFTDNECGGLR